MLNYHNLCENPFTDRKKVNQLYKQKLKRRTKDITKKTISQIISETIKIAKNQPDLLKPDFPIKPLLDWLNSKDEDKDLQYNLLSENKKYQIEFTHNNIHTTIFISEYTIDKFIKLNNLGEK